MTTTYRALDLLRFQFAPQIARREPYWRPPVPKPSAHVVLPSWDWEHPTVGETGDEMVDLDVNGAWIAALSSGDFAHGPLARTGPWRGDRLRPGYYQISTPTWQLSSIVSPLGSQRLGDAVWVMHPTLGVLQDLEEAGLIPELVIHDSYTAETSCRMRKWAEKLRDDRKALKVAVNATSEATVGGAAARKAYQDFKDSFAQGIQMMAGKDGADGQRTTHKCDILRPDWYHTVRAQHAATMWRKVWKGVQAGIEPFGMSSVDEVTYTRPDLERLLTMQPRPPFRLDPDGLTIGSFDVKGEWVMG